MVAMVTPAASVLFHRSDFEDILYAPIGMERNDMPLSVLSALARLDIDPWEEAAELSELSKVSAAQRLASLIARLPVGRWAQEDLRVTASRLVALLPRRSSSNVPLAENAHSLRGMGGSVVAKMVICAVLAAVALIIAASREPSRGDYPAAPALSTSSALP